MGLHADVLLVVALVWSNWEWPLALALGCTVLSNTHSFLEVFLHDVLMGSTMSVRKASQFPLLLLWMQL